MRSQGSSSVALIELPLLSSTCSGDALFCQFSCSWIATGIGIFFGIVFLIGAKEPQKLNAQREARSIEDQVSISDDDGKYDENDSGNPATKERKRLLRTNSTHSSIMVSQDQEPCSKAPK